MVLVENHFISRITGSTLLESKVGRYKISDIYLHQLQENFFIRLNLWWNITSLWWPMLSNILRLILLATLCEIQLFNAKLSDLCSKSVCLWQQEILSSNSKIGEVKNIIQFGLKICFWKKHSFQNWINTNNRNPLLSISNTSWLWRLPPALKGKVLDFFKEFGQFYARSSLIKKIPANYSFQKLKLGWKRKWKN